MELGVLEDADPAVPAAPTAPVAEAVVVVEVVGVGDDGVVGDEACDEASVHDCVGKASTASKCRCEKLRDQCVK